MKKIILFSFFVLIYSAMYSQVNMGKSRSLINLYMMKTKLLLIILFSIFSTSYAQIQLGQDIFGEASGDKSGKSVAISADGNYVIIGASSNGEILAGHARVFQYANGNWTQFGNDIDGGIGDLSGSSVSISADGKVVVIGAPNNDDSGTDAGNVKVFQYVNNNWEQLGGNINGQSAGDHSGVGVSLSADGNRVAIGANFNYGLQYNSGHVRIYEFINGDWVQLGQDIDGTHSNGRIGDDISLSADGNRIAIDSPTNLGVGGDGFVRIYEYNGSNWIQVGSDISDYNSAFGESVSLSSDGKIIAIGSVNGGAISSSYVKVYEFNGISWTQLGLKMTEEFQGDDFGKSVSLSGDGSIIAIGDPQNSGNGDYSGHVRIFHYIKSDGIDEGYWEQIGIDIDGSGRSNYSGEKVSISSDGSRTAIGAWANDGNGSNSGQVRVFDLNFNTIKGSILFDPNNNNCTDTADPVNNFKIVSEKDDIKTTAYSNSDGEFYFSLKQGVHIILPKNPLFTSNPLSTEINFEDFNEVAQVDFCATSEGSVNDVAIYLIAIDDARPGFDSNYKIIVENIGNNDSNGTITLQFDDNFQTFLNASQPLDSQTNNSLTFNYSDLQPFQTKSFDIVMNTFVPPIVDAGDILKLTAFLNTNEIDINQENNIFKINQIVVNSFDPNDIQVTEGSEISITQINEYLHYIIRFQNIGTSNATNVRIRDILDDKLDLNTFIPIASSHLNNIQITENNLVDFIFNDIQLPNSEADEPNSHGFIFYKIKPKSDVVINDIIFGTADIFFDFNTPITTNTVSTMFISQATTTYVPDDNFEQSLIDLGYDDILDDYVVTANISSLTTLIINNKNISSLKGIEDFVALEKLHCDYNNLTSINLNTLTSLTNLSVDQNNLESIDINNLTLLTSLSCNSNNLTSLDLNNLTNLTSLTCPNNQLTDLDFTGLVNLQAIFCSDNQFTSLDFSPLTSLSQIDCGNNQFTVLDFSNNPLTGLTCGGMNSLKIMYLKNGAITGFNFPTPGGPPPIPASSFNNCPNLEFICVDDGQEAADIQTHLDNLGYTNCEVSTDCTDNSEIINFTDNNFKNALLGLGIDLNNDNEISVQESLLITDLDINSQNIINIDEISYFTSLINFNCSNNQLINIDVSQTTNLTSFDCSNNNLTHLNIQNGNNTLISSFNAIGNTNLTCIKVDNVEWSTTNWTNIDTSVNFDTICSVTIPNYLLVNCDDDGDYDGLAYFDLTSLSSLIISYYPSNSNLTLTYHPTEIDAQNNVAYIVSPNNYQSSNTTVFVRIFNLDNSDIDIIPIELEVVLTTNPDYVIAITGCDLSDGIIDGFAVFEEQEINSILTTTFDMHIFSYYTDIGRTQEITTPTFSNTESGFQIIYGTVSSTIISCSSTFTVELKVVDCSQIVNIPDSNFKNALLNHNPVIDLNNDSEIQVSEAILFNGNIAVSNLPSTPDNEKIADLTGIEEFINITSLVCAYNLLTSVDLSQNILLTELHCPNNLLTSLDISNNISLTQIDFWDNKITEMDFSNSINLTDIRGQNNLLTTVDISQAGTGFLWDVFFQNNKLTSMIIKNGFIEDELHFEGNPDLEFICVDDGQEAIDIQTYLDNLGYTNCEISTDCSNPQGCPNTIITLSSQEDVNSFYVDYTSCIDLTNGLVISGSDIVDLRPLTQIKSITGGLTIQNNPILTNLDGLENIASITEGNLVIENNLKLTNILGLSGLSGAVGYSIIIKDNPVLTNLQGLENVTNPGDDDLHIENNDSLLNLEGLSGMKYSDDLIISENDLLVSFVGFENFEFTGSFYLVNNNSLVSLSTLNSINPMCGFEIRDNDLLEDLDGFVDAFSYECGPSIIITNNPNLSTCSSNFICDVLSLEAPYDPSVEIANNKIGCNNGEEIMNACALGQLDDDSDGIMNDVDQCPDTPTGETVNSEGCSESQLDDDGDGVMNDVDNCPNTPSGETVNSDGCAESQLDDDGDGVMNDVDTCLNTPSGETANSDGCSESQLDDDGDGIMNNVDNCPNTPSGETVNSEGCSESQLDDDGDSVMNDVDNCPNTPSGETVNSEGCSESQLDDDGDGIMNNVDTCPNTPSGEIVNSDGCAESELDDDGDGIMNNVDTCPNTPSGETVNSDGCAESQLDDDGDGIMNDVDTCPNTSVIDAVDVNGCFVMPSNNFQIEVIGETCIDKSNGQINITTTTSYNYITTIDGVNYDFTTSLTVDNLDAGEYTVCISVVEEPDYEQCFSLVIEEAEEITGKSSSTKVANKTTETIEISSGTAPYTLSVNGIEVQKTNATTFSVEVSHGDHISVSSKFACEGKFEKSINLIDNFIVYPNPTSGVAEIAIPSIDKKKVSISIFNLQQQLISRKTYQIKYGRVEISLNDKPTGMYLIQIELESPVYLKIIKQ